MAFAIAVLRFWNVEAIRMPKNKFYDEELEELLQLNGEEPENKCHNQDGVSHSGHRHYIFSTQIHFGLDDKNPSHTRPQCDKRQNCHRHIFVQALVNLPAARFMYM